MMEGWRRQLDLYIRRAKIPVLLLPVTIIHELFYRPDALSVAQPTLKEN